jgi:hypothetical protein
MQINPGKGGKGESQYEVTFVERTLEELVPRLNRFKRADEKPFEAVNAISDFNQRAYELFARPLIQSFSNEYSAKLQREFHPLRFQRWSLSDWNPWTWWLQQSAEVVKAQRKAVGADHPLRKSEQLMSELISASLDYYRALRDAVSEAAFFQIYGNLFSLYLADKPQAHAQQGTDPRETPVVKDAMAAIANGGYPEAVARVAYLLAVKGEPLPLSRLQLKQELIDEYHELLPAIPRDEARRIRGEQEIIVRYEPEKAMETLPALLSERADRDRLLTLLDRLLADKRVQAVKPSDEQVAALGRIRAVLGAGGAREQQREVGKRGQRSVH